MALEGGEARATPIVEAVLDLDCDLAPAFDLGALQKPFFAAFSDRYPSAQRKMYVDYVSSPEPAASPTAELGRGVHALRVMAADGRQFVQLRSKGFSFNRLAPYTSLSDYLPEIRRTWDLYVGLASPLLVRRVRLRYINRIDLPGGAAEGGLAEYFSIGPSLPSSMGLTSEGFLVQQLGLETSSGHRARIILGTDGPVVPGSGLLTAILDIEVAADEEREPADWEGLQSRIEELRALKNRVFQNTLTERCRQILFA